MFGGTPLPAPLEDVAHARRRVASQVRVRVAPHGRMGRDRLVLGGRHRPHVRLGRLMSELVRVSPPSPTPSSSAENKTFFVQYFSGGGAGGWSHRHLWRFFLNFFEIGVVLLAESRSFKGSHKVFHVHAHICFISRSGSPPGSSLHKPSSAHRVQQFFPTSAFFRIQYNKTGYLGCRLAPP